jgi:hypothetical protein
MSQSDLVAFHEDTPAPRLPQRVLGARRGARDGEPVYQPRWAYVAIGGAVAAPRRRRFLARLLALAGIA